MLCAASCYLRETLRERPRDEREVAVAHGNDDGAPVDVEQGERAASGEDEQRVAELAA